MTLPLRWRIACAVTSLLAVAALSSPAGGANVTSVSLGDASGDTQPSAVPQADITSSTATFKPAEIAFTLVTAAPEDPRTSPNWANPGTKLSWLIRTTSAAPGYDYELRYQMSNGALVGNVFSAAGPGQPLCGATKVDYSGHTYRASIDPACIGRPGSLSFAATMAYQNGGPDIITDGPDNGTYSAVLTRPKLGYWLVGRDGGIFAFGDSPFSGSTGGMHLNQPIVGMASNPVGTGYWFVASDGGIFAFGDAGFFGSTGAMKLNKPIVGMATTPNGRGYWLVASDGGIFAFGNGADFFGSTGSIKLAQPIVGMAATNSNKGYWFVAADGGIFSFGDALSFTPRLGGSPVTGVTAAPDGKGLWVTRANGEVDGYGSAPSLGGLTVPPAQPIVGIASLAVPGSSAPAPAPAP